MSPREVYLLLLDGIVTAIMEFLFPLPLYRVAIFASAIVGVYGISKMSSISKSGRFKEIMIWGLSLSLGVGSIGVGALTFSGYPLAQIQTPLPLLSQFFSIVLVSGGAFIAVISWLALGSFRTRYR